MHSYKLGIEVGSGYQFGRKLRKECSWLVIHPYPALLAIVTVACVRVGNLSKVVEREGED